jgi:hypothetical protein
MRDGRTYGPGRPSRGEVTGERQNDLRDELLDLTARRAEASVDIERSRQERMGLG